MKSSILTLSAILMLGIAVNGQTYDIDAIRFSKLDFASTARTVGVGGAFTSVGADMGAIPLNPGAIGMFRKSQFTVTPVLQMTNTETNMLGNQFTTNKYRLMFSNVGVVFSGRAPWDKRSGWVGASFALGNNRLASFNSEMVFTGVNQDNSITDSYIDELNANSGAGVNFDNFSFETVLAYQTWLANYDSAQGQYITPVNGPVLQSTERNISGNLDEFYIAFGGNYEHKFYIGGSIGFPYLRYKQTFLLTEQDQNNEIAYFQDLSVRQTYETGGVGINAKLGFIYKPMKWLRIGASIHSPSAFSLNERYSNVITHSLDGDSINYEQTSPNGEFDYRLVTPWRFNLGGSIFFDRYGFVSLDYEFIDYTAASYDFGLHGQGLGYELAESAENQLIQNKYTQAHNIRLGAELALDKLRFRGGYAMHGSPFTSGIALGNNNWSVSSYSGGIGISDRGISLDVAYRKSFSQTYYTPYQTDQGIDPGSDVEQTRDEVILTLGLKF